jgi:hypothetical protein
MRAEDYGVSELAMSGEIERREEQAEEREEDRRERERQIHRIEATIVQALQSRADYFKEEAAKTRRASQLPDQSKPPIQGADGSMQIDLTPTPAGFAHITKLFEEQEANARAIAQYVEEYGLARAALLAEAQGD